MTSVSADGGAFTVSNVAGDKGWIEHDLKTAEEGKAWFHVVPCA